MLLNLRMTKLFTKQNFLTGLVIAVIGLALLIPANTAKAQSISDLFNHVNWLLSQLYGDNTEPFLVPTSGSLLTVNTGSACPYFWSRSLGYGASGEDVRRLQQFLNQDPATRVAPVGAGSPGFETNYYGPLTADAVSRFQLKYSAQILAPWELFDPTGYFGQYSHVVANQLCGSSLPPLGGDGDFPIFVDDDDDDDRDRDDNELEGGAGSLDDADYISKLNNEEVGEDEEEVEVAGLDLEADDDSDLEIMAVRLDFDQVTADRDFRRYAEEVILLFEGDEVANVDADEFDDDNNFSRTISLDDTAIIRAGDTAELIVAITGASNIDSADEGESWTVEFDSLRLRDGQDAVFNDDSTGDIGDSDGRRFSFEDFATAADLELKITSGDDDINDQQIIIVDDDDETENVELFSFEFEVEGDSDVLIDDLPIAFTSTGAGVGEIIDTAELYVDGDRLGSESVSESTDTTRTVVFEDLDWKLDADEEVEVEIRVDVRELGGNFSEGDTLMAEIGETETDSSSFDAEDEEGNDLSDSDVDGQASSDAHIFYTAAPEITVESTDIEEINNGDNPSESALAKIELRIEAKGGTIYLNGDDETIEDKRFFVGKVYGSGISSNTTASSTTFAVVDGTDDVTNSSVDDEYWTLDEGEDMTISVQAVISQAAVTTETVLVGYQASAIKFGTDNSSDTTRSAASLTHNDLLSDTKTDIVALTNPS